MQGQDTGDSVSLTESSAVERLAGLLSDEEDTQPDESQPDTDTDTDPGVEATDDDEEEADPVESDESEEDDEPAKDEPTQPRKYKVKANGEDLEVTEDELINGYSRQADYTRKTQEHSTKVREFEQQSSAKAQEYATRFAQVDDLLHAITKEPDWNAIRTANPTQFAQLHQQWTEHKAQLDAIHAARVEAENAAAEAAKADFSRVQTEQKDMLLKAIPDLADATKGSQLRKDIVEYAGQFGFSPEDLSQVVDHRALVMLHKAMLYDQAQKAQVTKAPTVKQKLEKVKVATPTQKKSPVSDVTRARQRLAKTHREEDAVNALILSMDGDD